MPDVSGMTSGDGRRAMGGRNIATLGFTPDNCDAYTLHSFTRENVAIKQVFKPHVALVNQSLSYPSFCRLKSSAYRPSRRISSVCEPTSMIVWASVAPIRRLEKHSRHLRQQQSDPLCVL